MLNPINKGGYSILDLMGLTGTVPGIYKQAKACYDVAKPILVMNLPTTGDCVYATHKELGYQDRVVLWANQNLTTLIITITKEDSVSVAKSETANYLVYGSRIKVSAEPTPTKKNGLYFTIATGASSAEGEYYYDNVKKNSIAITDFSYIGTSGFYIHKEVINVVDTDASIDEKVNIMYPTVNPAELNTTFTVHSTTLNKDFTYSIVTSVEMGAGGVTVTVTVTRITSLS